MREGRNRSWERLLGCRDPPASACVAERGGRCRTKAPSQQHHSISSPHGTSSLLSPQPQAQLSRETPMEKLELRSSPHVQGDRAGARSQEHHWDRNSSLIGLAFPASLRPFPPSDVVAGKPKQTSLNPLPHNKDRLELCLNTSDCGEAPPTLLGKTKTRSKTTKSPAEISSLVLLG